MPPNVLLVVLDSVRAQNTSLHGYDRATTPFLEEFSDAAVTYEQARAPGMTSLPSHTSIFTGLAVEEHGAHDSILHEPDPRATIWDELRRSHGYGTGVFSYNPNLVDEHASLRDAFDHVEDGGHGLFPDAPNVKDYRQDRGYSDAGLSEHVGFLGWAVSQGAPVRTVLNGASVQARRLLNSPRLERTLDRQGDRYLDAFLEWCDDADGPWAACVNLLDAHHPYYPEPTYDRWGGEDLQQRQSRLSPHPWEVQGGQVSLADWAATEDLYDGAIRQLDSLLESLVEVLRAREALDDTLVVVTSDHGEGFGERSRVRPDLRTVGHETGLHECLLHVPLLVKFPGQTSGRTVEEIASLDRFPAAVRSAIEGSWDGREFVPDGPVLASGSNLEEKLDERASRYCYDAEKFSGVVRAVYRQRDDAILKYVTWGDDAATVRIRGCGASAAVDEGDPEREVADAFEQLAPADVGQRRNGDVDEGTKRNLADLGYV